MSYKQCSGGLGPASSDWSQNSVGEGGGGVIVGGGGVQTIQWCLMEEWQEKECLVNTR